MTYFEIGVLVALALIYFSVEGAKTRLDLLQDIKDRLNAQNMLIQSLTEKISIIERNCEVTPGVLYEIRDFLYTVSCRLDNANPYSFASEVKESLSAILSRLFGLEFEIQQHVDSIKTHLFSIEKNTNKNLGRDEVL